jgi:probable HAF family extracellular repeat protein
MRRLGIFGFAVIAACRGTEPIVSLPPPPPAPPPPSAFEDVRALGTWMSARGINDAGTVVGLSSPLDSPGHRPVVFQNGTLRVLEPLPGAPGKVGSAEAINQQGIVAGFPRTDAWQVTLWDTSGTRRSSIPVPEDSIYEATILKLNEQGVILISGKRTSHQNMGAQGVDGFIVNNGALTWLGYLTAIPWMDAVDMNSSSQVVGRSAWFYHTGSTIDDWWDVWHEWVSHHPVLWSSGTLRDIGVFGRTTDCTRAARCASGSALAINDRGDVVGYAEDSNLVKRPFLWRNGTLIDLAVFLGKNAVARAINNRGQIAGDGEGVAFLWDNGVARVLGSLDGAYTEVTGINEQGDVIGTALTASGEQHAFVFTDNRMIDLGLGLPNACASTATAVNERGDVLITLVKHFVSPQLPAGTCIYRIDDPRLARFDDITLQRAMIWHKPSSE